MPGPNGQPEIQSIPESEKFGAFANAQPFASEVVKQLQHELGDTGHATLVGQKAKPFKGDMWLDVLLDEGMIAISDFGGFEISLTRKGQKFAKYLSSTDPLGISIEL